MNELSLLTPRGRSIDSSSPNKGGVSTNGICPPRDGLRKAVFAFIAARGYRGATDSHLFAVFGPARCEAIRQERAGLLKSGHIRPSPRVRSSRKHACESVWITTGKSYEEGIEPRSYSCGGI